MLRWAITHIVDPFRVPLPPVQLVAEPIGDNLIGPEIRNPDLEEEAEELALALLHDWRNPNEQDNYFPPIEENLNELIPQQPNHIHELIPEQPNNDVSLEDLLRLALDDRNLHLIHRYVKHILNLINKRSDNICPLQRCQHCYQPFRSLGRHVAVDQETTYGCRRVARLRILLHNYFNHISPIDIDIYDFDDFIV
jgi:hypothetical protein